MQLHIGDNAPNFSLEDQDGKKHSLSEYQGEWVLLYFYPKDDTPGCTKEACSFRDNFPKFAAGSCRVIGVSTDTVTSHKKFVDKYGLPFILLADPEKKVVETYGVWGRKKFMGREYDGTKRTSFLINPKGKIAKIYEEVKPELHPLEVLADMAALIQ